MSISVITAPFEGEVERWRENVCRLFNNFGFVNIISAGVRKNVTVDQSDKINKIADACRSECIPIYFPPGEYYVTSSLNFTGANNDNGTMGWKIYGAGPDATKIVGNLSTGRPIIDLSDNENSLFEGICVNGHASGSQICGILHSMVGSNLALQNTISRCLVNGTYSEAGYINVASDLCTINGNSWIQGPCGVIVTSDKNALGAGVIASDYVTITATPNCTLFKITDSSIVGVGGDSNDWDSAIVQDEFEEIVCNNVYFAQDGVAKAGIIVDGESGGQTDAPRTNLYGCRYENQTDAPEDGCMLWVASEQPLRNCEIDCFAGASGSPDTGTIIYLEGADLQGSRIRVKPVSAASWSHFVQAESTHVIRDCEIIEGVDPGTLKNGADSAYFGVGNIIHLYTWNSDWMDVADGNIFITSTEDSSGHGLVQKSYLGFNAVGKTTSLARRFTGSIITGTSPVSTTASSGDEALASYTLPGDIGYCNTGQNCCTMKLTAFGSFASNANAKTIKVKFGQSGSESTLSYNDVTASPNDLKWWLDCDITRVGLSNVWYYASKIIIGNVVQSVGSGSVSVDPSSVTIKALVTGDASASDITLSTYRVEIF